MRTPGIYTAEPAGGPWDTVEARKTLDTTRPGLSADGHRFGEDLTPDERRDLLAYLVTL